MQCLYCETELKPLRGLFDEDFCCKEHREKYFASFRKGITMLPVLDLPPLAPLHEIESDTSVELAAEEPAELVSVAEVALEEEAPEELPVMLAAVEDLPAPEPAAPVETIVEPVVEAIVELPPPAFAPEPVFAVAETIPVLEAVSQVPEMVSEAPALVSETPPPEAEPQPVPVLVAALETPAVGASIEAAFDDTENEAAMAPPEADFLHLDVAPFGAADCYFMIAENSFPACNGPAIPDVEVFCDAEFDPEERLASLIDPAELVAAGAVNSDAARASASEPMAHAPARLTRPSFLARNQGASSLPVLEMADVVAEFEIAVAGHSSQAARYTAANALSLPPASLELLALHVSVEDAAHPHVAEPLPLDVVVQSLESVPLVFRNVAAEPPIQTPVFQVSAAAMQLEEELKRAIEPPKTEAVRMAEPEIARPAVMSAAPVSRASAATFQPPAGSASVRSEAQLNVPAMSSKTEAEPRLASEVVPDIAPGSGADQLPAADTSQPVQPAIENSARIKNWRLKITFAKPA